MNKDYKLKTIELLKKGYVLKEISDYLKVNGYNTNSLSSIEKYVLQLKKEYKCNTMYQLGFKMNSQKK